VGDQVVLTASPNSGYTFVGWGGDASGSANPVTVGINGNKNVTITFSRIPCTYAMFPTTNTFGKDMGFGVVDVTANSGCSWTASTNPGSWGWVGVSSDVNGVGNGKVCYYVLPNNSGKDRTGILTIAGQTFTITQSGSIIGPCGSYTIAPTNETFGKGAGFGVADVTADSGCLWSAWTNSGSWGWVGISSDHNGTGNGKLYYFVLANNTGKDRTGTLTIAGQTLTITQSGTVTGPCGSYAISPTTNTFGKDMGFGVVNVTADDRCLWSAWNNAQGLDWIGISSDLNETGNGKVYYFVLANDTGKDRTGALTIAGETFTVMQSGSVSGPCSSYAISPTSNTFGKGMGFGVVDVTADSGCLWSAWTNPESWDWIGISSDVNGVGNGRVYYFLLPNSTGKDRTGILTIAGKTFTITQSGTITGPCSSYMISPMSNTFGKDMGSGVVNVTANSGCLWSAWTNPESWDWIGISSGWNGTGNGSVHYFILANNTSVTRTGILTVAGQTFTITQQAGGCTYSISPTSNTFQADSGSGSINVIADPNCSWTASTNSGSWDWIGITSGTSGTGSGTVNYILLANNTGSPRTGTLTIAGQAFTITQQAGGGCTYSISLIGVTFAKGGGSDGVNVTASSGCSWSASTNSGSWDWIGISSGWSGTGNGTVNYFLLPNNTGMDRTGTLIIAGKTFMITQSGQ
jgi:uncharacterized repeat protein (TIGR02543 family)